MVVKTALKVVTSFITVAESDYGFARTCFKVYKTNSPTRVLIVGIKSIILKCNPPIFKSLLLWASAIACSETACVSG